MATQAKAKAKAARSLEARVPAILKDYALAWVLLALFLGAWAMQFWTGWETFAAQEREHGASAVMWGRDGYLYEFSVATLENWQSEFLQLLTFVVLTSFLVFKGSPESKSSDEETQKALEKLTQEVKSLRQGLGRQGGAPARE